MSLMQTRSQSVLSTSLPATVSTETIATPHITFIHESHHLPDFSGTGTETVHQFIQRIEEDCSRRAAISDKEKKISILKSRICHEPSSLAGLLVKSERFASLTTYDDFTIHLRNHFQSHSKYVATHSLLKLSKSISQHFRSHTNPYQTEKHCFPL